MGRLRLVRDERRRAVIREFSRAGFSLVRPFADRYLGARIPDEDRSGHQLETRHREFFRILSHAHGPSAGAGLLRSGSLECAIGNVPGRAWTHDPAVPALAA